MKIVCPSCSSSFPIEAGLLEDEAKRFGSLLADMEPVLARAALGYLRLFKPLKTELRIARAAKILQELVEIVGVGKVCRDERGGIQRPATQAMWAAGIEQMLTQRASLELPISGHVYLRKVVYGIADGLDAKAETQREADRRNDRRAPSAPITSPLTEHLSFLRMKLNRGHISQQQHDEEAQQWRDKYNGGQS